MPKRTPSQRSKQKATKSIIWPLGLPARELSAPSRKTTKPKGRNKPQLTVFWGGDDESPASRQGPSKPIKQIRNPWVPDDIVTLLKFLLLYPAGRSFIELVKAWMDYRNAKEIEIKVGDVILRIKGHISERVLKSRIETMRDLIQGATSEDIEVNLPKGAKRTIPAKLVEKARSAK